MSMDPISSDCHLNDLRRLYDHTESHVRSLRSLGIEAASYGALLSPVLLAKLPPDLRLIVSRKVSDSNLDMDALLSTFEEELTARKRANPQLTRQAVEKPHHTFSALFTGTRNSKLEPQCCYCQQFHPSHLRPTLLTVNKASRPVAGASTAYVGAMFHETVNHSPDARSATQHHTSICNAGQEKAPTPHPSTKSTLNPEARPFATVSTTTAFCSYDMQTIFLQTAQAIIHHPRFRGSTSHPGWVMEARNRTLVSVHETCSN